jgi:hypothetical protein
MIEVKSTLNGDTQSIDKNKAYLVDFSKFNSVNDLVLVLSAMGISFPGDHVFIEQVKPFLNLENPIDLPQRPQQQSGPAKIPLRKTDLK